MLQYTPCGNGGRSRNRERETVAVFWGHAPEYLRDYKDELYIHAFTYIYMYYKLQTIVRKKTDTYW